MDYQEQVSLICAVGDEARELAERWLSLNQDSPEIRRAMAEAVRLTLFALAKHLDKPILSMDKR